MSDETCIQCGTRLMIMSYSDRQHNALPILEEHFLERISALEYGMGRLDERLNEIQDLVQQLAAESLNDHAMIESIADALKRLQIVSKRDLGRDWQKRVTQRLLDNQERERFESSKRIFLNAFRGKDRLRFANLIEECGRFFVRRNYQQGLKVLEKAFSTDPQNYEVGIFLSKVYYEFENFADAHRHLRQVLRSNPYHFEANLLTGLLARRKGDLNRACEFLTTAVDVCQSSLSAQLFLGSVLVSLGRDGEALGCFARALDLKPSPQMYLLVGSIYSRQGRVRNAIRLMKKAIEMDPNCHEAFFQLGLAFLEQNWRKKAKECFQTALHLNPRELRYRNTLELFLKNRLKGGSSVDLSLNVILNDKSMETLVKDELQLNFRRPESDVKWKGDGVDGK
ncbi:MAG: tetratricopeptide repeat protein [Acidobacteriota bacterium]